MIESYIFEYMETNNYITNLLGAFATTVSTQIEQAVANLGGRSLTHESALVTIRNHPNDTIHVLSKALGLTHSGGVRLINTLEEEGLVERHRSEEDARAVVLRVTTKGRRRADNILQAREQVIEPILTNLTDKQQQSLIPILEASLRELTGSQEGARRICRLCDERTCRPQGCPVELEVSEKAR